MLGKTHISTGVAASLIIVHPTTITGIVGAVVGGTIGAGLCDLDTRKSQLGDGHLSTLELGVILLVGTAVADFVLKTGVYSYILKQMNPVTVMSLALFLAGCVFGFFSPHRSFTHSILALVFFSVLMQKINPLIAPSFTIGFISHLALDLLNKRGMQLLFPFKHRFCLDLCSSDGEINDLLGKLASLASTVLIVGLSIVSVGKHIF